MSDIEFISTPKYMLAMSDRELSSAMFYADAAIIEGQAYACEPEDYAVLPYETLALLTRERDKRLRLGIEITHPGEDTFEQRFAPFGVEWELEQMERVA